MRFYEVYVKPENRIISGYAFQIFSFIGILYLIFFSKNQELNYFFSFFLAILVGDLMAHSGKTQKKLKSIKTDKRFKKTESANNPFKSSRT